MKRILALVYGAMCYIFFLGVFLRAIWFVWTMDQPSPDSDVWRAAGINSMLLGLFAAQHSIMARPWFKRGWVQVISTQVERSTYVLAASVALLLLVEFWQPLPRVIWDVQTQPAVMVLRVLFWCGWAVVLGSTFLIDHADLFGLRQVWKYFRQETYEPPKFQVKGPYHMVRHPLYLGFLIAFWSAPRMTAGHLFFAVMTTAYILLAIQFEEKDLISYHGEPYAVYRSGVSMLVPWPGKKK